MPKCSTATHKGIDITFEEESHTYWTVWKGKRIEYTSGTTFVSKFFHGFDAKRMAPLVAKKRGVPTEEILKEWDEKRDRSCIYGTMIHETCEDVMNGSRTFRHRSSEFIGDREKKTFSNAKRIAKEIREKYDVVGIEKIVFSLKYRIAGTIDLLVREKDRKNSYVIIDYKTNADLDTLNKYGKYAKDPVSNIPDTPFGHYQLQLSTYEFLLKNGGFIPKDAKVKRMICWMSGDEHSMILLPDRGEEVRKMLGLSE